MIPNNSVIFSLLHLFSAFVNIKDKNTASRHRQILYFFSKTFTSSEFMNFFLIDLTLQWFLETCQTQSAFLSLLLNESRDLLDVLDQFNHKIRSVESVKSQGILFSVESFGYLGILQNTQNNTQVNRILSHKSKTRKEMLNKLSKNEPIQIVYPQFRKLFSNNFAPVPGMVTSFREENFYSVDCKIDKVLGLLIVIKLLSFSIFAAFLKRQLIIAIFFILSKNKILNF